ncbi:MAG: DsbC family protein [Gammaproteobacteria bacterium]|nr:DsbC family protein [Gammaproteobacteria bacterium]NNJ84230.1 DsbC family protein [Gammaproteobacteria bacterium]
MSNKRLPLILLIAMLWPPMVLSEKNPTDIPDAVIETGKRIFPNGVDSTDETPIQGLFEMASGTTVIYVSKDGKFAVEGDVFDLEEGENLTERKRNLARKEIIANIDEKDMITFTPEDTRHTITVFTDVDCGYCRKLHNEVSALNKAGIKVRYLGFPRAGPSSDTYKTMVSVWCADDRRKAMTNAKKGEPVPNKQCAHPLDRHIGLGGQVGVRGTPAIALEDGTLISGYLPAARLQDALEKRFHGR